VSKRLVVAVFVVALACGCAVTTTNLRTENLKIEGLAESDAAADAQALRARVEGLWGSLEQAKLTTFLTKDRIAEYFETEKDRSDFIAIYATLFRQKKFEREYVQKFKVGKVIIQPNGVLAHVEVNLWGKVYAIWSHRIHDVQTWQKINGAWMMKPETF
jgi:hypothetical protein